MILSTQSSTHLFTHKVNGTGLGLSLSKKITEAHGGALKLTSSDETGTVFTMTLPI